MDLLGSLAEDPFHEVQEEACGLAVALNGGVGRRGHGLTRVGWGGNG